MTLYKGGMEILRNAGLILLFASLGIGLGSAAFYVRPEFNFPKPKEDVSQNKDSGQAKASVAAPISYQNSNFGVGFSLPVTSLLIEESITSFSSGVNSLGLKFVLKKSEVVVEPTNLSVYFLQSLDRYTPVPENKKRELRTRVLKNLVLDQTYRDDGSSPSGFVHKQYLSTDLNEVPAPDDIFEMNQSTTFVLIHLNHYDGITQISPEDVNVLMRSLHFIPPVPASDTNTSSSDSSLLLNPNL